MREDRKKLSDLLNKMGSISMILGILLAILRVWVDNPAVNKLNLSDIIFFVGLMLYYLVSCYEPKEK